MLGSQRQVDDAVAANVRDAAVADMDAVQAIYAHHVRHGFASFEEVQPTVADLTARRAAALARDLPYLVAETDGRIAGFSYAVPYRSRSAYRHTVENSVYVAEGCEGRGIGRLLLSDLIARCEAGPWRQMVAIIGDSGNTASIALHRSLGFEMTGTLTAVGFKHGRWVDTVLMQRRLGVGSDRLPEDGGA